MQTVNLPLQDKGGELRSDNLKVLQNQKNEAELDVQKLQAMYTAAVNASQSGDILSIVGDNKAIQDAKDDYDRGLRDRARRALTDLRQQDPAAFADVLDEFRTG